MFLSIVIPVYNGEKTVLRCLNSIARNFGDYEDDVEVIVVDDGSEDNTVEEIQKSKLSNLKLIIKENGGVSLARNVGIETATGKYIWFIDSDDFLVDFDGTKLLDFFKSKEADAYLFGFKKVRVNEKEDIVYNHRARMLSNLEFCKQFASIFDENEFNAPWNKVFRLSLIKEHKIRFVQGMRVGEDATFNCQVFNHAKTVYILNQILYRYSLDNSGKGYQPYLSHDLSYLNAELKKFCNRNQINPIFFYSRYVRLNWALISNVVVKAKNNKLTWRQFKKVVQDERLPREKIPFNKLNWKLKVLYLLTKFYGLNYLKIIM